MCSKSGLSGYHFKVYNDDGGVTYVWTRSREEYERIKADTSLLCKTDVTKSDIHDWTGLEVETPDSDIE